jgi:hypothetical protein
MQGNHYLVRLSPLWNEKIIAREICASGRGSTPVSISLKAASLELKFLFVKCWKSLIFYIKKHSSIAIKATLPGTTTVFMLPFQGINNGLCAINAGKNLPALA